MNIACKMMPFSLGKPSLTEAALASGLLFLQRGTSPLRPALAYCVRLKAGPLTRPWPFRPTLASRKGRGLARLLPSTWNAAAVAGVGFVRGVCPVGRPLELRSSTPFDLTEPSLPGCHRARMIV
jgi:hypothetical protein